MQNYPYLVGTKSLKPEFSKFEKIIITSEEFTIGRSLENSLVIPYIPISRKHCTFRKLNESDWGIEDFSSFGIEVNNKKLKKGSPWKLTHDDTIQLDSPGEFVYKFVLPNDNDCTPRKRIKLEEDMSSLPPDIINNVKLKFEESQNFEIKHIEEKIQNAKQMQTTSIILKQQLELDMSRKVQALQNDFAMQIENLKGEKNEVERLKVILEEERDLQLASVKQEMQEKITDLMDQIQKHNESESELLKENTSLKEKLLKEREDFLAELHRENSSKQDMLQQLETRMKEQEEIRLREKQELEILLKNETEQLRLAKEKELQELEEQKKLREQELQQELSKMKVNLEEQVNKSESERARLEQELKDKIEEMKKASDEEKSKVLQERAEAEEKLKEAEAIAEKSREELQQRVNDRETELAALAAQRIQQQADQSTEVITSLQQQLENVRSQLQSVETEKNTLLESICCTAPFEEGSSKQATLTEFGELMESELQCSICAELFVQATTLSCSHTFCKYCIGVWKKKKNECPICRARITSECKSLVLDSFIEKAVANLTEEMKKKREGMLKDREELELEYARQNSAGTSYRRSSYGYRYSSFDEYDSEQLEEEEEDEYDYSDYRRRYYADRYDRYDTDSRSDSLSDASDGAPALEPGAAPAGPVSGPGAGPAGAADADGAAAAGAPGLPGDAGNNNTNDGRTDRRAGALSRRWRRANIPGTPGAYYGGYGRCFRCGARGHWAPGCPF